MLISEVSYPLQESGRGCVQHFCDGIHGKAMAVEKDSECFLCAGSASVCVLCGPLIVAVFTFIALFLVDASIFDEVWVLTSWALHKRNLLVVSVLIFVQDTPFIFLGQ